MMFNCCRRQDLSIREPVRDITPPPSPRTVIPAIAQRSPSPERVDPYATLKEIISAHDNKSTLRVLKATDEVRKLDAEFAHRGGLLIQAIRDGEMTIAIEAIICGAALNGRARGLSSGSWVQRCNDDGVMNTFRHTVEYHKVLKNHYERMKK